MVFYWTSLFEWSLLATTGLFFSIFWRFSSFNADSVNVSLLFFYPVTTSSKESSSLVAKDADT